MRNLIRCITVILLLSGAFSAKATHIVGGSLTYEHLGGAAYRVTLKLYRDCGTGNAQFPGSVNISVFENDGTAYSTINIPFPGEDTLDPFIDTCAFNPGVCVAQAIYTTVVNNLVPGNGGYHMIYQICCRNSSIINVPVTPFIPGTGTTYYSYIPENFTWLTNSSPDWVNFPPVFICANQPLVFDHSATDADGDSLAYNLYWPFEDDAFTFAANQPNFTNITYNPGYSFTSPLEPSAPAQTMNIDPQTGILTTTPPQVGQYVVGIVVEEWRNGQLLSRVYRDFQFNVLNCPPPALAGIGDVDACSGLAVQMDNQSTSSANGFEWDFGDGSAVSNQFEPTHTYTGIGSYTLTLIAQAGTPCADTATKVIDLSFTNADFTYTDSACVNTSLNFTDGTTTAANGSPDIWLWDFGDGNTSTLPNPSHTYTTGGDYTVQLITESDVGCRDTIDYPIYIQDLPVANAGSDTTACENNPLVNLNGSVSNASGGLWVGPAGASAFTPNSSTLNADYLPDAAEVVAGSSEIVLSTVGNGFCPAATDTLIITYVPGPSVDAGPDVSVCKDTTGVPLSGTVTIAGGGEWTSSSGNTNFLPANDDLNATYVPSSTDTANGSVTLYLTTILNGNCIASIDSMEITFFDPPTVDIIADDTTCTGQLLILDGNTTTGAGFWTTNGSGTFSPNDSTVQASYLPSAADESAGSVQLIFNSLNNGGCRQVYDTLDITIIPAPEPLFDFDTVCFNQVTTFTDQSTSVTPITDWTWEFGDGNSDNNQNTTYTFGTEGPQQVSLIVTSLNNCTDTLIQTVDVNYLPDVGFYNSTPCLNGGSQFIDTTTVVGGTPVSWSWDFGDGNTSTDQDPLNVYASSGTYSVTLTVTSDQGCTDFLTQNSTVLPGPTADFILSDTAVNLFEQVSLTDQSTPQSQLVDWFWEFGDTLGTSTSQNPTYAWNNTGIYSIMLVVTDVNGCMDTTFRDITVFMPPHVPDAFTPNGDGTNDTFFPLGGPFTDMNFRIYNNWGEVIFESASQSLGWDGTYNKDCLCGGGVEQPLGVYVWTLEATTLEGSFFELSGDVTLLR